MTKLSELSDFEINKRVAVALDIDMHFFISESEDSFDSEVLPSERGPIWQTSAHVVRQYTPSNGNCFNPCNNPTDAWPIILEHGISIISAKGEFICVPSNSIIDGWTGDNAETIYSSSGVVHKNPLRAAMIVFLEMQ